MRLSACASCARRPSLDYMSSASAYAFSPFACLIWTRRTGQGNGTITCVACCLISINLRSEFGVSALLIAGIASRMSPSSSMGGNLMFKAGFGAQVVKQTNTCACFIHWLLGLWVLAKTRNLIRPVESRHCGRNSEFLLLTLSPALLGFCSGHGGTTISVYRPRLARHLPPPPPPQA